MVPWLHSVHFSVGETTVRGLKTRRKKMEIHFQLKKMQCSNVEATLEKIRRMDYEMPAYFSDSSRDLIQRLLQEVMHTLAVSNIFLSFFVSFFPGKQMFLFGGQS